MSYPPLAILGAPVVVVSEGGELRVGNGGRRLLRSHTTRERGKLRSVCMVTRD
jgi:hypothetical protein